MSQSSLKLGLALGAGGARGWCHVGVLRALEEMGLRPDVVAGTSMGSIVGAIYAAGKLDALEEWALGLSRGMLLRLMDVRLSNGGLIEGGAIETVFKELDVPDLIEELPLPFAAVACDMGTGQEVCFDSGPVGRAVRASAALPGALRPARSAGAWCLDGGQVNPVPVSVCKAMGADVVIGVDANAHPDGVIWHPTEGAGWPALMAGWRDRLPDVFGLGPAGSAPEPRGPGYATVITATVEIMMDGLTRARLSDDPPDLLLEADLADKIFAMEFDRADEAITEGRRMVEAAAPRIAALFDGAM